MASVNNQNRLAKPFYTNSPAIFTLPLGGKIIQGWVILTGTVVIAGGTTNGTAIGEGGPVNLIERIKITATPSAGSRYPGGKIVDCTPRSLLRYAIYQRNGGKFVAEQSGSTLGGGAAGTYEIYLAVPIFFADSNLRNEMATALNTDGPGATPGGTYASVQVQVDTADLSACFAGNDRSATSNFTGLTVQWVDCRIGLAGDTLVRYQEDHIMQIGATNWRALDEAMPNDGAFESWLFLQEQSTALTLSNALLEHVVVASPNLNLDLKAPDIYQQMLDNGLIDASQTQTGQLFLDFTLGMLANSVQAGPIQAYYHVINVSGAYLDDLRIMTRRVFSPIPQSK
jgi:hypothetical protein